MPKSFGEVLKQIREEKGLTQKEMADFIKMPQSSLSKYENDQKKRIDWDLWIKILSLTEKNDISKIKSQDDKSAEFKKDIIQRIVFLNNRTSKEIVNDNIRFQLKKFEIKESNEFYEIRFRGVRYEVTKQGFSKTVNVAVIIFSFISELLEIFEDEIKKDFHEDLVEFFVEYNNLKKAILNS